MAILQIIIITAVVWVVTAVVSGWLLIFMSLGSKGSDTVAFGCFSIATISALVYFISRLQKMKSQGRPLSRQTIVEDLSNSIAEGAASIRSFKDSVDVRIEKNENELFAFAEAEVDEGRQNKGLWSKALIQANGDESRRKIEYMKLRMKQIRG